MTTIRRHQGAKQDANDEDFLDLFGREENRVDIFGRYIGAANFIMQDYLRKEESSS